MIRTLLASEHPFVKGITLEELDRHHSVRLRLPDPFLPFAEGGFGTASGKCEFHAETIDFAPPVESRHGESALRGRFPLELISPKNDDSMNSTFGNRPDTDEQTSTLKIHSSDADGRAIRSGDSVRVFNDRGSVVLIARVTDNVREGVVATGAVRWNKRAPDHRNINALTPDRLTDAGGGPCLYSCLVQVEKSGD